MEVNDPTELHPMEGVDSLFEERAAINDNRDFERGWKKWYLLGILSALALIALRFLEGFIQTHCGVEISSSLSAELLTQKNG